MAIHSRSSKSIRARRALRLEPLETRAMMTATMQTVCPTELTGIIKNPGTGYQTFYTSANNDKQLPSGHDVRPVRLEPDRIGPWGLQLLGDRSVQEIPRSRRGRSSRSGSWPTRTATPGPRG